MKTNRKRVDLDEIYRERTLADIPWNNEVPPDALVDLVKGGRIKPCRTLDMGCGAGNYAIYLAKAGFEVTGLDIAPTAVKLAQEKAARAGVRCDFLTADVLGELKAIKGTFDFIYDWQLLHHIFPRDRKQFVANVTRLLRQDGKYLSCCFSEKDPQFGGSGKYRRTSLGTVLFFSSEQEIRELFESDFDIMELKTIEIQGKTAPHKAVYAFMQKK